MDMIFHMLTPRQADVLVIGITAAAILYAILTGRVFLMPYSVTRQTNARAFYVLLTIIAGALFSSIWHLSKAG